MKAVHNWKAAGLNSEISDLFRFFVAVGFQIRGVGLFAFVLFAGRMPFHPFGGGIEGFAAVFGESLADAAHHWSVDADAGDDGLAFGQGGEFGEHGTTSAFDGLGDCLLIDRVNDAHNYLRHALRQNVLVEFPRTLCDEADPDSEFAAFAQYLFEDVRGDHAGTRWGKPMSFFEQREHRVVDEILARRRLAADGHHAGLIDSAEQGADDHLLLVLLDVGKLKNRAAAGFEKVLKRDVLVRRKNAVGPIETRVEAPKKTLN